MANVIAYQTIDDLVNAILNVKSAALTKVEQARITQGERIKRIEKMFSALSEEEVLFMVTMYKRHPIMSVLPESYKAQLADWSRTVPGSRPALRLGTDSQRMLAICNKVGLPSGEKVSWSDWLRAKQGLIMPIVAGNFILRPTNQQLAHGKALFALLSFPLACELAKARMELCFALVAKCMAKNPAILELKGPLRTNYGETTLPMIIAMAKEPGFFPSKAEVEAVADKEMRRWNNNVNADMVCGAYPVSFLQVLQNIDLRRGIMTANDREALRKMITQMCAMVGEKVPENSSLKDKDAAWFKAYFRAFNQVRAICKNVRAVVNNNGEAPRAAGEIRNLRMYNF